MKYKILFLCLCLAGTAWVIYRLANPSTPVVSVEAETNHPECLKCVYLPSDAKTLLSVDVEANINAAVSELLKKVNPKYDIVQVPELNTKVLLEQALASAGHSDVTHLKIKDGYWSATPDDVAICLSIQYDKTTLQAPVVKINNAEHIVTHTDQQKTGSRNTVSTKFTRKSVATSNSTVTSSTRKTTFFNVKFYTYETVMYPKVKLTYSPLGPWDVSKRTLTFTKILEPVKASFTSIIKL
jgi:hypothetical protein